MELIEKPKGIDVKAAVFDFDGTISTLRYGWEKLMAPLFYREINGSCPDDEQLKAKIDDYIFESTGIQTVFQMKWLVEQVKSYQRNPVVLDEWGYKAKYNVELLNRVNKKIDEIKCGKDRADNYVIDGSRLFLSELKKRGVKLYVASGTDNCDVVRECDILGFTPYFDRIVGAPEGKEACSKEAIMRELIFGGEFKPNQLTVFGDGKVEIKLAREFGATAVGLATDEQLRHGVNAVKRERLLNAGANVICGDFLEIDALLEVLKLR